MTKVARVEVQPQSMVVGYQGVPSFLDDNEYRVRLPDPGQRDQWRGLRPGDHIDPGHPLVAAFPAAFSASTEPITTWPYPVLIPEAAERRHAEIMRRTPSLALRCQVVCTRDGCGWEHDVTVDVPLDKPHAGDLVGQLDPDDPAARAEVYARFDQAIAAHEHAEHTRNAAIDDARRAHPQCADTVPAVEAPEVDPKAYGPWRLPWFRTQRG